MIEDRIGCRLVCECELLGGPAGYLGGNEALMDRKDMR
jgi:hypothetical protein